MENNLANCAHCGEYPCEMLKGFFKMVPDEAKANLDRIYTSL